MSEDAAAARETSAEMQCIIIACNYNIISDAQMPDTGIGTDTGVEY